MNLFLNNRDQHVALTRVSSQLIFYEIYIDKLHAVIRGILLLWQDNCKWVWLMTSLWYHYREHKLGEVQTLCGDTGKEMITLAVTAKNSGEVSPLGACVHGWYTAWTTNIMYYFCRERNSWLRTAWEQTLKEHTTTLTTYRRWGFVTIRAMTSSLCHTGCHQLVERLTNSKARSWYWH